MSKHLETCPWAQGELYVEYHDSEWGQPCYDEHRLFEKLCLEGQQAGLSWITVLKKRPNYRARFHGFDPEKINRKHIFAEFLKLELLPLFPPINCC